jgi:Protein of unknown function (DUF4240)
LIAADPGAMPVVGPLPLPACRMTSSYAMDTEQFWNLIGAASLRVADPADGEAIAALAAFALSHFPREEIIAAQRVLTGLMAASYRKPLWAAAYLINGGCSDDGFEYFRGWLIAQGREVFEHAVAAPDSLADLPVLGPAGPAHWGVWEQVLYIPLWAYKAATGAVLPADAYPGEYPELEADPDFELFDNRTEMERRLPRLTSLCWRDPT